MHVLVPLGHERRGFLVGFTERTGGVSDPPYDTLNLGFRTGDEADRVRVNRARVTAALEVPPLTTARQVHGAEIARVDAASASRPVADADAMATSRPEVPLAVLVADCVPVCLVSEAEDLLVVVHAGWRGLAAGLVPRAVALFDRPRQAAAAIGPAVGPCHYEVGADVADAVERGSAAGAITDRRDGRLYLDLAATAETSLGAAGIREVDVAGSCTACEPARFFSHRRDGPTGRQALVAMRLST